MKKQGKDKISMKWRMIEIMLMCWFLPFCLIIGVAGYYILSNRYGNAAQAVVDQLAFNNQICVERLNAGIAASRKATYDQTLERIWKSYERGDVVYNSLYSVANEYINKEYRTNQCFSSAILWSFDEPERMNCGVYNNSAGGTYQQIQTYWREDHDKVKAYLDTLDTALGYIYLDGRLYMVRNLMDNTYKPFGALIMRLDLSYCFGPLIHSPQGRNILVCLDDESILLQGEASAQPEMSGGDGTVIDTAGETAGIEEKTVPNSEIQIMKDAIAAAPTDTGYIHQNGALYVFDTQEEEYFKLAVMMEADRDVIQTPFYGYPAVFIGMLLSLIPLLLILLRVFNRNVNNPVAVLMKGSDEVIQGNLGYQITEKPENLEFKYLIDSFNQMSEKLKYQFDHIYEEELALRDAKIMALQSNINPHFMNNTLEIINWEARMGSNEKVSRMIEALATLMDAAMDRKRRATVPLSEEMIYVNAYLYIISERYGKRLTIERDLDESIMQYEVPRLILQPVIENAIEHGVRPSGRGTVVIKGYVSGDYLCLEIINDGTLTEESSKKIHQLLAPDYDTSREPSGNLGIANVNQRLRILYGDPCGLTIEKLDETHVTARLTIACR